VALQPDWLVICAALKRHGVPRTDAEGLPEQAQARRFVPRFAGEECMPILRQISTWLPSSTTRPGGKRKYSVADPDNRTIAANSASCHSGIPGRAAGTRIWRPRT